MSKNFLSIYVGAILFSVPFFCVGYLLGGYVINITLILFLGLIPIAVGSKIIDKPRFILLLVMSAWCVATSVMRWPLMSYLPSLAAFFTVCFPFCLNYTKHIKFKTIFMGAIYGFLAMLPFALYDAVSVFHVVPPLVDIIPYTVLSEKGSMGTFAGLLRSRGLFLEPAHYALYLVFFYVAIDIEMKMVKVRWLLYLKVVVVTLLVLTFSVGGYVMLALYSVFSFACSKGSVMNRIFIMFVGGAALTLLLALFFGTGILDYAEFSETLEKRLNRVTNALFHGGTSGSEGARISSFLIPIKYISEAGVINVLAGEGYANYEYWAIRHYGSDVNTSVLLHNLMSIVFLSTGFVGFVLYMMHLYKSCAPFGFKNAYLPLLIFIPVSQSASGNLVTTVYWGAFLFPAIMAQYYAYKKSTDILRK